MKLFELWICWVLWVHTVTGRELQRYTGWKVRRRIERMLREQARRANWN